MRTSTASSFPLFLDSLAVIFLGRCFATGSTHRVAILDQDRIEVLRSTRELCGYLIVALQPKGVILQVSHNSWIWILSLRFNPTSG